MKLVDDGVREMQWRFVLAPIKFRFVESKNAERCTTCICSRSLCRVAPKRRRKEHSLRIGIEQNLIRIKCMPMIRTSLLGPVYAVGVITGVLNVTLLYSTMPNPFGLVTQVIEPDLDQWRHIVVFIEKKERHLGCVFGVKRKVVCLLFGD